MNKGCLRVFVVFMVLICGFSEDIQAEGKAGTKARAPHHGIASWYSRTDRAIRRRTASGEIFNDTATTCASWHFPLDSYVKITNIRNGKSVICRVNDRGPRLSLHRTVDLTKSSFRKIANPKLGLVQVTVMPLPLEWKPAVS